MAKSAVNYTGFIPETGDSFESATQNTTGSLEGIDTRLGELGSGKADLVGGKIPVDQISLSMNDYREGYYKTADGLMYQDSAFTILLDKSTDVLYLDLNTTDTYRWTGTVYLFTSTGALSSQTKSGLMSAFDKKKLDKKIYTFDTIADAQASTWLVKGDIIEVLGYYTKGGGGGHKRVYSLTDDGSGEIVTSGGFLIYKNGKGVVNVDHFGCKKDGTDDSVHAQKASDYCSGKLLFGKGTYKINITNSNEIEGTSSTYITPYNTSISAIKLKNHNQGWSYKPIKNLSFLGNAQTGIGIDFYDFVAGRYSFHNCDFKQLDKAFWKNLGNIGLSFYNCDFEYNNIAVKFDPSTVVGQEMHNGNTYFHDCQFSENIKHVFYFSADPSQVIIDKCILEYNHGIWFFCKGDNSDITTTQDVYPSIVINSYIEGFQETGTMNIDGIDYDNNILTFVNSRNWRVQNSNLGRVHLHNSILEVDGSFLTGDIIKKGGECYTKLTNIKSYVNIQEAEFDSISVRRIESVNYNYMFKKTLDSMKYVRRDDLDCDLVEYWSVEDIRSSGIIDSTYEKIGGVSSVKISKNSGEFYYLGANETKTFSTDKYCVLMLYAKTDSDSFKFTNSSFVNYIDTNTLKSSKNLVAYTTISKISANTPINKRGYITCVGVSTYMYLAGYAIYAFDSYQEAIQFINNPCMLKRINYLNLEGVAVDFSQYQSEEYWYSLGIDFDSSDVWHTKFNLGICTNTLGGNTTNYPEAELKRTVTGIEIVFKYPTRTTICSPLGKRYVNYTSF